MDIGSIIQDVWDLVTTIPGTLSNIVKTIINLISVLVDMVKAFTYNGMTEILSKPVEQILGTEDNYQDMFLYKCYSAIIVAAFLILLIFFVMRITDLMFDDKLEIEEIAKAGLQFFFTAFLMDNLYPLFIKLNSAISTGLFSDQIKSKIVFGSTLASVFMTDLGHMFPGVGDKGNGLFNMFYATLKSLTNMFMIPLIIIMGIIPVIAVFIYLKYFAYYRAVKLGMNIAVTPLMMAGSFQDSFARIKAIEHIKKIIALFLQVPVILITLSLCVSMFQALLTGNYMADGSSSSAAATFIIGPSLLTSIIAAAVIIKVLKTSEDICEEIVGV